MFVETIKSEQKGRTYHSILVRETYRDNGKVKHRTVANLSKCPANVISAVRLALKTGADLNDLEKSGQFDVEQGPVIGSLILLKTIADRLGITRALGGGREGTLALWQVIARTLEQGSRLSSVRLAQRYGVGEILNLNNFDEDDLYGNLDYLAVNQAKIEGKLLKFRYPNKAPQLYFYDVTSSYLEGTCNHFAAFGYNRDRKKGKMQIVVGLLCDEQGAPLSIEVFEGNTLDPKTFYSQIDKVRQRFGAEGVVFVGDRGMIKMPQIAELQDSNFHFITAITKEQIKKLLNSGSLQMELFDQHVTEITTDDGIRYILRRNPTRQDEIRQNRQEKSIAIQKYHSKKQQYVNDHPKASMKIAKRDIAQYIAKLKLEKIYTLIYRGRKLILQHNEEVQQEIAKLDGCYAIKTDLSLEQAGTQTVHDRYKALAQVEWAFRTSKTGLLEMRPVYVTKKTRTQGHVFVVMLSYLLAQELAKCWSNINQTVEEGLRELSELCSYRLSTDKKSAILKVPKPRKSSQALLDAANVALPKIINPVDKNRVATKAKLQKRRKYTNS